jgi:transposase
VYPLQTSDALGAAASQLGPRALALAADLHTGLGLPIGKVSALFETAFWLVVTSGGLCLALHRVARRAEPTYRALVLLVRHARVAAADETGWKVGGWLQWLWVFVTVRVTVYAIQPGRGYEEAVWILGAHFAGILNRDGWAPCRQFTEAEHQSCLMHVLRRCHEIFETAERGAARLPHAIQRVLKQALALRDRRDAGSISPHGLAVARGRLEARMDRLLTWQPTVEANRKLVQHLRHERSALRARAHRERHYDQSGSVGPAGRFAMTPSSLRTRIRQHRQGASHPHRYSEDLGSGSCAGRRGILPGPRRSSRKPPRCTRR